MTARQQGKDQMDKTTRVGAARGIVDQVGSSKYILFRVGEETLGLPILQIQEIISDFDFTHLPFLPKSIHGVISLRGLPIPVINLRKRFNFDEIAQDGKTRVVIVELSHSRVGVQVDEVYRVATISSSDIQARPTFGDNERSSFISGVTELTEKGKKFVILLDIEKMLTAPEEEQVVEAAEILRESWTAGPLERVVEELERSHEERAELQEPYENDEQTMKGTRLEDR